MRVGKLIALALAGMLLMAACGREGGYTSTYTARMKDMAFEGIPAKIRGSTVRIAVSNVGKVEHELGFLDIGNASLDDLKRGFEQLEKGGPFPSFFRKGAFPFELEPGKSKASVFTLRPGRYLMFCALTGDPSKPKTPDGEEGQGPPHFELGMYKRVTVEGTGGKLAAPDGQVTAREYTFDLPKLRAGTNELVFRNAGPKQLHHLVAFEFPAGVTEQRALQVFKLFGEIGEDQPPPPGTPEPKDIHAAGVFSPGLGQTFDLTLKSGRTYLFACFMPDLTGGPPHAFGHNMVKTYAVP